MAGILTDGGRRSGRKALDSDINMIPMIDLLMVTVSFLLITAVWSHMARLEANAKVPGADAPAPPCDGDCPQERELHVDLRHKDRLVLSWHQGGSVLSAVDIPRRQRFEGLAEAVAKEWRGAGEHRAPTEPRRDRAVLHTGNDQRYEEMILAMDAIAGVTRPAASPGRTTEVPAFRVVLSAN
jgi:biopolymer transport protein ExbD